MKIQKKQSCNRQRKPEWLKIKLPGGDNYVKLKNLVEKHKLNTICTSGKCPNQGECWNNGTATFMILGNTCSRNCKFCSVNHGEMEDINPAEPQSIAQSVKIMNLKHVVLTSVTRDDLADEGASHWAQTIKAIRAENTNTTIEVLIPDMHNKSEFLDLVIEAAPEVISHNVETVKRLTPLIRSNASYDRSLKVLSYLAGKGVRTKSGIMLGLGETTEEIKEVMQDIKDTGVSIITIGQYLQPTKDNWNVAKYYTPAEFKELEEYGLKIGFEFVESAPFVRSSYHAEKHLEKHSKE